MVRLGSGGMGALGWPTTRLGRKVALRLLRTEFAMDERLSAEKIAELLDLGHAV